VDPKELRRLVAEVDEEHRDTMRGAVDEMAETFFGAQAAASSASRRSFLQRVGVGGLLAAGGVAALAAPARAAESATTGSTLPARPTTDDLKLIAFAQSVELAAVEAYAKAAGTGKISSDVLVVAKAFMGHHREHAQALSGLAGSAVTNKPNGAILAEFGPKIERAGTEKDLLEIAFTLETAAASSYAALVGLFSSSDACYRAISIGPIEARHAVVLGTVLGKDLGALIPALEPTSAALTPSAYPIGG
jgi:hypothetical protein